MLKKLFRSLLFLVLLSAVLIVSGCDGSSQADGSNHSEQGLFSREMFSPRYESGAGKVIISEVMSKNKTTFPDAAGDYPDWIEIENITDRDMNLSGWMLADDPDSGWVFPDFTLYAHSRAVIFASKKDSGAVGELHASFAVSEGETVLLKDRNGDTVSSAKILKDRADFSYIPDENGICTECGYPTPGRENTLAAYVSLEEQKTNEGPLVISEAYVSGDPDWVEIQNISDEAVQLADYILSENSEKVFPLPEKELAPGGTIVIDCTADTDSYFGSRPVAPFSLNANSETLFLSDKNGNSVDSVSLKNIPNGCSFGRVAGKNGSFYFEKPTPGADNSGGKRYITPAPQAIKSDGIFNGIESTEVELMCSGTTYYTTNGSKPTRESSVYKGPFTVDSTCVVRAFSVSDEGLDSSITTLNYIINEGHDLPVACLSSNDIFEFNRIYYNKVKDWEISGNLAFYDLDGTSFSVPCGIRLNGFSTLRWAKKNMNLSLEGKFGEGKLQYDLFGGGNTSFSDLILRGGGDQLTTVVRNEACCNLCARFTDKVAVQRSRYCVLYINGEYFGIYTLIEKADKNLYASFADVSAGSVTVNDATVEKFYPMYRDVLKYILEDDTDLSLPECYQYVCEHMDIDSFIDWCVFEGWTGNNDLVMGNLKYANSHENGGKWSCILYDLDLAFISSANCMVNVADYWNQVTMINDELFKNAEYKDKFLKRMNEALTGVLTEENLLAEMERLYAEIDSEVPRDGKVSGLEYSAWKENQQYFRSVLENNWNSVCVKNICSILGLSEEERDYYFKDIPKITDDGN